MTYFITANDPLLYRYLTADGKLIILISFGERSEGMDTDVKKRIIDELCLKIWIFKKKVVSLRAFCVVCTGRSLTYSPEAEPETKIMGMKKLFIIISLALLSANIYAEENAVNNDAQRQSNIIVKADDYYILGDKTMTKEQYLEFIQANCAAAWASYQKGNKLWKTGWGLLGAGIGVFVAGTSVYGVGAYDYFHTNNKTFTDYNRTMVSTGAVVMAVGAGLMTGAIPCLIVGGIKRNNSHEVYNELNAGRTTAVTFGIRPSTGGMAMLMEF